MITCGSRATRAAIAPAITEKPSSVTDMIQRAPVAAAPARDADAGHERQHEVDRRDDDAPGLPARAPARPLGEVVVGRSERPAVARLDAPAQPPVRGHLDAHAGQVGQQAVQHDRRAAGRRRRQGVDQHEGGLAHEGASG